MSPLAAIVVAGADGVSVALAGGEPGFLETAEREVAVQRELIDAPFEASVGDGVALLSLVPGVTETLRINGRVTATPRSGRPRPPRQESRWRQLASACWRCPIGRATGALTAIAMCSRAGGRRS